MRYVIKEKEGFTGCGDEVVRVFHVKVKGERYGLVAQVWVHQDGGTCCTVCSGPLTAMREDCKHCQAVKRFLKKGERHG